jgi:hypothetical protein
VICESCEQVFEVSFEDLVLLLLDLHGAVVWWEHKVNFATQTVDACYPVVGGVGALLETVFWVFLELKVHLVENVFQVKCKYVFGS